MSVTHGRTNFACDTCQRATRLGKNQSKLKKLPQLPCLFGQLGSYPLPQVEKGLFVKWVKKTRFSDLKESKEGSKPKQASNVLFSK